MTYTCRFCGIVARICGGREGWLWWRIRFEMLALQLMISGARQKWYKRANLFLIGFPGPWLE